MSRAAAAAVPGTDSRGLVLVVEDEGPIAEVQRLYLQRDGFGVAVERTGAGGLAAVRRLRPVAVVLDVGLPDLDGTEVCRRLRSDGDWTPIIFVTARDEEVDRILGLELGADDYLTKLFSPRELVVRVRTVLRRARGELSSPAVTLGPLAIDQATRHATVDGRELGLTATEFDLLAFLARRPGRVWSREQLLAQVWGYGAAAGTRTVDVHVAQLRAKLGPAADLVRTGAPRSSSPSACRVCWRWACSATPTTRRPGRCCTAMRSWSRGSRTPGRRTPRGRAGRHGGC